MTGSDDCTPIFRDAFLRGMLEAHGKTDMEDFFGFSFAIDGKKLAGLGVTVHFINSAQMRGPIYSEFRAVLVGDFLYYYRASFPEKVGLKDLAAFLREIGFEKRANQTLEPTTMLGTSAAEQPLVPSIADAHRASDNRFHIRRLAECVGEKSRLNLARTNNRKATWPIS